MAAAMANNDTAPVKQKSLKFRMTAHGLTPSLDTCNENEDVELQNSRQMDAESETCCGKCDKEINDFEHGADAVNPTAIACDICKTYFHQQCGGL
jgi:hypothetical protein